MIALYSAGALTLIALTGGSFAFAMNSSENHTIEIQPLPAPGDDLGFREYQSALGSQLFPDRLIHIKLGLETAYTSLDFAHTSASGFNLAPNFSQRVGAGFDYGVFGAYFSFVHLDPQFDSDQYGNSYGRDVQFHFYFERVFWDLYYQKFRGFYADGLDEPHLFPDLSTAFFGVNFFYVLRPSTYHPGAAFTNTLLQRRDGGSWYLGVAYTDQSVQSPESFVPQLLQSQFVSLERLRFAQFRSLPLGGGYGYTWVWNSGFFVALQIYLGLGPQLQQIRYEGELTQNSTSSLSKAQARFAIGYNGKKYFTGIQSIADNSSYRFNEENLTFQSVYAQIYFGIRL